MATGSSFRRANAKRRTGSSELRERRFLTTLASVTNTDTRALSLPLDQLADPLAIPTMKAGTRFDVSIRPPGSKSLTNRALLLAALSGGRCTLDGALTEADDARVMISALEELGASVVVEGSRVMVNGVGGASAQGQARWRPAHASAVLNLQNAGTATRFLTAAAMLMPVQAGGAGVVIDGNARMRERPIGELGEMLVRLGARVDYLGTRGHPPLRITPPSDLRELASEIEFPATASSQFISAMLLVAPCLANGLTVISREALTSPAYIDMTVALMRRLGIAISESEARAGETLRVSIVPQRIEAFEVAIEPDASGATYFHGAAVLVPGARCEVPGLDLSPSAATRSLQGDTNFVQVLAAMGAKVERTAAGLRVTGPAAIAPVDMDLSNMPDTAMTAAVLACCASPTASNPRAMSTFRGLKTLRVKETDRLAALQTELTKLGARVEIVEDVWAGSGGRDEALRITPPAGGLGSGEIEFDTYDDHRMAMSLALVGLRRPNVRIRDPRCVRKTYPNYFQHLANLYA